jgi:hypothetical protein
MNIAQRRTAILGIGAFTPSPSHAPPADHIIIFERAMKLCAAMKMPFERQCITFDQAGLWL